MDWKDILSRAAWAALWTFLSSSVVIPAVQNMQWALLIPPAMAALAAAMSTVKTIIVQKKKGTV